MPLILDQLVIQLGECATIGLRGEAKGKGRPTGVHAQVSIIPESAKQPKANRDGSANPQQPKSTMFQRHGQLMLLGGCAKDHDQSNDSQKDKKPPR
jgi:hypothetical protein